MDYEKAYKDALNRAKLLKYNPKKVLLESENIPVSEYIFPELRESEEEKIKKELINYIKTFPEKIWMGHDKEDVIAWLEKQDNKLAETNVCAVDLSSCSEEYRKAYYDGYNKCNRDWLRKQDKKVQGKSALEAINEENVDNANKVESTFQVGDWVVRKDGEVFRNGSKFAQIQSIELDGEMCYFDTGRWLYPSEMRLWTIDDAKAGDVLYYKTKSGTEYILMNKGLNEHGNINSYFRYNSLNGFGADIPAVLSARQDGIMPATKEQRDFLFQKMREAGYEWNSETKELNKDNENNMKLIESKAEYIPQTDLYKHIELCGRTAYKSEDKITEDSAKGFVDRMIKSKHGAVLEHGTVYLTYKTKWEGDNFIEKYQNNPYSSVGIEVLDEVTDGWKQSNFYITTNYRVIIENGWLDDMKYVSKPTMHHEKRYTIKFTGHIQFSKEARTHRPDSFVVESTRYCNYIKGKFGTSVSFMIPSWLTPDIEEEFKTDCETLEKIYFKWINKGYQPQQAAYFLCQGTKASVCMTGFASDWRFFFDLRYYGETGKPHPDMELLAGKARGEFIKAGIWEDIMSKPSKFDK